MSELRKARRARMKARGTAPPRPVDTTEEKKPSGMVFAVPIKLPEPETPAADALRDLVGPKEGMTEKEQKEAWELMLAGAVAMYTACVEYQHKETLGCGNCWHAMKVAAEACRDGGCECPLLDAVEAMPMRPEGASKEALKEWARGLEPRMALKRLSMTGNDVVRRRGKEAVTVAAKLMLRAVKETLCK